MALNNQLQQQVEEIVRISGFGATLVGVSAGQKLYGVMPGDKVRVTASLQYRGPALSDYFYAAIGEWRGISWPTDIGLFDEIWKASKAVTFSSTTTWASYTLSVDIAITEVGSFPWTPGWFDVYAKIGTGLIPRAITSRLDNVIEVLLKSEFKDFSITSYDRIAGS